MWKGHIDICSLLNMNTTSLAASLVEPEFGFGCSIIHGLRGCKVFLSRLAGSIEYSDVLPCSLRKCCVLQTVHRNFPGTRASCGVTAAQALSVLY